MEVALKEVAETKLPTTRFREISTKPEKVEVAVVEVALKVLAETKLPTTRFREISTRPEKVEVAVVEVALKYDALTKSSNDPIPATDSFQFGEVVPTPTLPPPLKTAS